MIKVYVRNLGTIKLDYTSDQLKDLESTIRGSRERKNMIILIDKDYKYYINPDSIDAMVIDNLRNPAENAFLAENPARNNASPIELTPSELEEITLARQPLLETFKKAQKAADKLNSVK